MSGGNPYYNRNNRSQGQFQGQQNFGGGGRPYQGQYFGQNQRFNQQRNDNFGQFGGGDQNLGDAFGNDQNGRENKFNNNTQISPTRNPMFQTQQQSRSQSPTTQFSNNFQGGYGQNKGLNQPGQSYVNNTMFNKPQQNMGFNSNPGFNQSYGNKSSLTCTFCGKPGHTTERCFKNPQSASFGQQPGQSMQQRQPKICSYCGKVGHEELSCFKKQKDEGGNPSGSGVLGGGQNTFTPQQFPFPQQQTVFSQQSTPFGQQQPYFSQNSYGQQRNLRQPQQGQSQGNSCGICNRTNHTEDNCFHNPNNPKSKNYKGPQRSQQGGGGNFNSSYGYRNPGNNQTGTSNSTETQVKSVNANLGSRLASNPSGNNGMAIEDVVNYVPNQKPDKSTPFTAQYEDFPILGREKPLVGDEVNQFLNDIDKNLK